MARGLGRDRERSVMLAPQFVIASLALAALLGTGGVGGMWLLRRLSTLSARNLYPPAVLAAGVLAALVAARWWDAALVALPFVSPWVAGAVVGGKWRSRDLGAGEELRNHELSRRWIWQPGARLPDGDRRYLRSQGELVHERAWPGAVAFVSMTARREHGARLPLGAGQHVVLFGATGAGKTTTARRLIAARTLAQNAALLVLDQKGDREDVEQMRQLAAVAGVPFVLFDSQDAGTDRWQPLWGSPDKVASRAVEPIKQSEPYYYDVLRRHLDIVCKVLHASGTWPPSIPLLVDASQPAQYDQILQITDRLGDEHAQLKRRAIGHGRYVESSRGTQDLSGGAFRLEVALALAGRTLVTPRTTPDGESVAVRLVEALRERAVVMWRTHADTMPDEAAALSVLALADLHDAAEHAGAPWTLLLDEFGAVIEMAAQRGVAILQRGRSPPRAGDRDHPIRRGHRRAHPKTRVAREPDRQLRRCRRAPTNVPGVAGLAGEADGHPRAVAEHQPNQRPRIDAHRPRQRPPRPRVPDRLRHLRIARPRRSRDLHAARRRTNPRPDPPHRPALRRAVSDRSGRPQASMRDARAPGARAPRTTSNQFG